jgi:hypothetical protein
MVSKRIVFSYYIATLVLPILLCFMIIQLQGSVVQASITEQVMHHDDPTGATTTSSEEDYGRYLTSTPPKVTNEISIVADVLINGHSVVHVGKYLIECKFEKYYKWNKKENYI